MEIKVKYFDRDLQKLEKISKGNWIDLRAAEDVILKKGEFKLIPLGIAMELPRGYEAHVVPRSSTFKNFGIIQTNHHGIIDGKDLITGEGGYCGDNDQWFMPVYCVQTNSFVNGEHVTVIKKNERICQFRIMEQQPEISFIEVEHLESKNRGGHGSTGTI